MRHPFAQPRLASVRACTRFGGKRAFPSLPSRAAPPHAPLYGHPRVPYLHRTSDQPTPVPPCLCGLAVKGTAGPPSRPGEAAPGTLVPGSNGGRGGGGVRRRRRRQRGIRRRGVGKLAGRATATSPPGRGFAPRRKSSRCPAAVARRRQRRRRARPWRRRRTPCRPAPSPASWPRGRCCAGGASTARPWPASTT